MEVLSGIISGICTGIGIGGGSILIPLLDIIGYNHHTSQSINLICFIPAAIMSIFYNIKKKNVNFKNGLPILIFGLWGAIIGSNISKNINVDLLKKIFGFFLILIALYEAYSIYIFVKTHNKD